MEEAKTRVAVIGAGFAGLAAVKQCLDAGFEVEAFEAQDHIGGQWAYQDCALDADPSGTHSSIYKGTMLNSCRDTTSFTDFPIDPARYGEYFTHDMFLRYLHEYADHFGLLKHVHLQHKVLHCTPNDDGTWGVRIQAQDGTAKDDTFGAVFACTGHLSTPIIPDFKGLKSFQGQFLHSHVYRTPSPFQDKKVVVIGLGSSAVDIACEIGPLAKEVHVVTRRGGWILPRYILGKPVEAWDSRLAQVMIPPSISEWLQMKLLHMVDITPPKELIPEHGFLAQSPTLRSDFLEKVVTGVIKVQRGGVESINPTSVELSTGETIEADVIICATGYNYFDLPYLPEDVLRTKNSSPEAVELYKLVQPPRYENLFLLGFVETLGPFPPAVEAQARYVTAVLGGKVERPSQEQMWAQINKWQRHHAKVVIDSDRHRILEHSLAYMDELLEPLGVPPTWGRLLGKIFTSNPWTALKVLNAVWFGVPTSAQYRLCGDGRKETLAKETMLRVAAEKDKLSQKEVECLAKA